MVYSLHTRNGTVCLLGLYFEVPHSTLPQVVIYREIDEIVTYQGAHFFATRSELSLGAEDNVVAMHGICFTQPNTLNVVESTLIVANK